MPPGSVGRKKAYASFPISCCHIVFTDCLCLGTTASLFRAEEFFRDAANTHGDPASTQSGAHYGATDAAACIGTACFTFIADRQRSSKRCRHFNHHVTAAGKSASTTLAEPNDEWNDEWSDEWKSEARCSSRQRSTRPSTTAQNRNSGQLGHLRRPVYERP